MQNNPPAVRDTVSTHVHQNDITVTKTKHNTNKAERIKSQELRKLSHNNNQLKLGGWGWVGQRGVSKVAGRKRETSPMAINKLYIIA